jgi:hypothetical protein
MGSDAASSKVVQNGAMLAVTLIEPGVVTAAVLDSAIPVISISNCGVVVNDPLRISTVAVFVVEVICAVGVVVAGGPAVARNAADALPLVVETVGFADKVIVTPDGTFEKVNRIRELFTVVTMPVLFVKFCVAVRHAPAKPAETTNEPVPFATLRLVRMAAVP